MNSKSQHLSLQTNEVKEYTSRFAEAGFPVTRSPGAASGKWLKEPADLGFYGVYTRIFKGGVVKPGDKARIFKSFPENITCAAISKLAFDGSLQTKATLNLLRYDLSLIGMNRTIYRRSYP